MKRLVCMMEANYAKGDNMKERSEDWAGMTKDELEEVGLDKASANRELKLIAFWRGASATMKAVAQAFGDAEKAYRGKSAPGVKKKIAKKAAPPEAAKKA